MNSSDGEHGSYVGPRSIFVYAIDRSGALHELERLATISASFDERMKRTEVSFEMAAYNPESGYHQFLSRLVNGDVFDIEVRTPTRAPQRWPVEFCGMVDHNDSIGCAPKSILTVYRRQG